MAHKETPRKRRKNAIAITKQQRKAARLLLQGETIKDALTGAGYSEAQARKGKAAIRNIKGLCAALEQEAERLSPERQKALIKGRLIRNLIDGQDRACHSAKLLGQTRDLNMFKPDEESGVINIVLPESAVREMTGESKPVLDVVKPRLLGE